MSSADREVIAMANRPRERMDRMEHMAKQASRRRIIRAAMQQEAEARRRNIIKRIADALGAMVIVGMMFAMCIMLIVL